MSRRLLDAPELNVLVFAFLLHGPWETMHFPFYEGVGSTPHRQAALVCGAASVGDAVIALLAFWAVAAGMQGGRRWLRSPSRAHVAAFTGVGILITAILEIVFTAIWPRWAYSDAMPVLLGVGLVPIAQWLLLQPLTVWFVRRQLT